jgi:hypothetical protein
MMNRLHFFFISLMILFTVSSRAQDSVAVDHQWHFLMEPYLMLPNMSGTVGLGELPDANVEAGAEDVFNHLQFGAMLFVEAQHDHWSIGSDLLYMHLNQEASPDNTVIQSGEVDMKQLGWELSGLYTLLPWLDAGIGARLNNLQGAVDLQVNTLPPGTVVTMSKEVAQTWVDPIIIVRLKNTGDSKIITQLRGDIGGFGIGSEFAWQVQANIGYRFTKLFQTTFGYRYLHMKYENGSGDERFLYDMDTFGPVVRFGFNF